MARQRSSMPAAVSLFVLVGFFGTLARFVWKLTDEAVMSDLTKGLVGALVIGLATVLGYWLGSSEGSRRKDETTADENAAERQE